MSSPRASASNLAVNPNAASLQTLTADVKDETQTSVQSQKTNLDRLLDKGQATYEFLLKKIYNDFTADELGEFLHELASRNQFDEITTLLNRRPDVNVNYRDMSGNTPLHVALGNQDVDFALVHLLCEKGGKLAEKNARKVSPLQMCFSRAPNVESGSTIKELLRKWESAIPIDHIQEIFVESARRKMDGLTLHLLETYQGKLNVKAAVDPRTANQAIHQAVSSDRMEVYLLTILIREGATLQDTNTAGKTPVDLLLQEKAYEKIISLAYSFSDALKVEQLDQIFQQLIQENRYDIYARLLVICADEKVNHRFAEQALNNAARHLPLETVTGVIKLLLKQRPLDVSLLKYINLAAGADLQSKKLATDEIVRGMLQHIYSPQEIVMFVNLLEAETRRVEYPNLSFFRDRKFSSVHGHMWKGEYASGTWVRLMEDAQRKVVAQSQGHYQADPLIEKFLGQRTRERHFCLFSTHPERRFLDRYLKNCAAHGVVSDPKQQAVTESAPRPSLTVPSMLA